MKSFNDYKNESLIAGFFKKAIKDECLGQAYILEGEKGTDKLGMALTIASVLLCDKPGEDGACGKCHSCKMIDSKNHPDCIILSHEKPESIVVDEIREQIINSVDIRPYYGGRKIYILPDAQYMTPNSQNALLKTIEEPPSYAVFFILVTDRELLLPTIRSRCVIMSFREEPALKAYNEMSEEIFRNIDDIFAKKETADTGQIIAFSKELAKDNKEYLQDVLTYIEISCRNALLIKSGYDLTADAASGYIGKMSDISYENLEKILRSVERTRHDLLVNVTAETALDSILLQIKDMV
ncbi:MAG: hypothetical protein K6G03_01715 [Lachnospiraceae bacterium]|nr:hypothetical protein [Lachnospiraceae bacterium]